MLITKPDQIGRVVRILDKYTIIVDAGKSRLSVGDTIQIYDLGDVIFNLNGEPLGYYVLVKDELNVIQTEDTFSVCQKNKNEIMVPAINALVTSPMLERSIVQRSPMNVEEEDIQPLNTGDKTIHLGDAVKLA